MAYLMKSEYLGSMGSHIFVECPAHLPLQLPDGSLAHYMIIAFGVIGPLRSLHLYGWREKARIHGNGKVKLMSSATSKYQYPSLTLQQVSLHCRYGPKYAVKFLFRFVMVTPIPLNKYLHTAPTRSDFRLGSFTNHYKYC